jgi:polar amino acid transport system substrate-binding protein
LLTSFALLSVAGEKPRYVDGIDAAFPPFSYIDEDGDAAGFDVEVVQWIAGEMGFEVKVVPVDWDAIIPTLKIGNIDMIASGMTITQKRLEQVDFTDPYWSIDLAVIVQEGVDEEGEPFPQFNIFSAVAAGRTIGVQRGTTSQTWIEENLIDEGVAVKLKLYDSFLLAVEDLLIGRVDAAVMDEPTARSAIANRDATIVGTINTGEIYGYAVRKGDKELLSLLNEGLKRIKASDEWDRLVEEWLIGD